mmetsp:Transcript_8925/g.34987  ORF Transcript_8925/g.34987 Transcript_8925/m.34987 type:complete len:201 (-) Transcript_8925:502-1104(-)
MMCRLRDENNQKITTTRAPGSVRLQRRVRLHLRKLPDLVLPRHRVAQVRGVQPLAKVRQRRHFRRVVPQRRLAPRFPLRPRLDHLPAQPVVRRGAKVETHVRGPATQSAPFCVVGAVQTRGPQPPHPLERRPSPTDVELARHHLHFTPVPRRRVQQQGVVRVAYGVHARGIFQHRLGWDTRFYHVLGHRGGLVQREAALL